MSRTASLFILFIAAILETAGDATVRSGLHMNGPARWFVMLAAAVVLFAYGWTINAPPWDFGKLLGIYVVFFFVVAQSINWIFFKQQPTMAMLVGGALIVSGGAVIAFSSQ